MFSVLFSCFNFVCLFPPPPLPLLIITSPIFLFLSVTLPSLLLPSSSHLSSPKSPSLSLFYFSSYFTPLLPFTTPSLYPLTLFFFFFLLLLLLLLIPFLSYIFLYFHLLSHMVLPSSLHPPSKPFLLIISSSFFSLFSSSSSSSSSCLSLPSISHFPSSFPHSQLGFLSLKCNHYKFVTHLGIKRQKRGKGGEKEEKKGKIGR